MPTPAVSIGLITYNRADIIHLAIEQLLAQTYQDIELIISDNASTDETENICRSYGKKDHRVRYIRQEKNIGMYRNFNFVLSQARGTYFMWATDDDVWDKTLISQLVSLLHKYHDAVVAASNYQLFKGNRQFITPYQYPQYTSPPRSVDIFLETGAVITYGLHRTEYLKKTGGFFIYPSIIPPGIGETILLNRILIQGGVAFINKPLWKKQDSGYTFERFKVLKRRQLSPAVKMRVKRYLSFPLLFHIDLAVMIRDDLKSPYSVVDKIFLIKSAVYFYLTHCIEYCALIVKGVMSFVSGYFFGR